MQIHELTLKKKTEQLDEGIASSIGSAVGKGVGAVKKVGTAVANPFRDVAAGYRSGKVDSKTNSIATKAHRAWTAYRQQLDKAAPGGKADPATVEKQLMAFVSKNLLSGQYVPNLINKDQIIKLVKQIAGSNVATQAPTKTAPPATVTKPGVSANATQDAVTKTPAAIEKGKEVALGDKHYRWLGAQWAEVNPKTGKAGQTAEKAIAPELTKMAQAGKFAQPFIAPGSGELGADQKAANLAAGKKAAPYGFDTTTGKPLPKPTKAKTLGTVPSTPAGATTTSPAAPTEQPIFLGGKKLDPKNPNDAKVIAQLKSQGKLQEALQPAQELELFKKLVTAAAQAQPEVATGQSNTTGAGADGGTGGKKIQNPKQMIGAVTQAVGSTVDATRLKAAGDAIRKNFQIDAAIGSTEDDAVDALLMAMGFQPA